MKIKKNKSEKPKAPSKISNRTVIGLVCIVLALAITFGIAPLLPKLTEGKVDVIRMVNSVKKGQQITEKDIRIIKVGEFNLPKVLKDPKEVIGKYATADLFVDDYIFKDKITNTSNSADDVLNTLNGSKVAISVAINSFAEGVSDKLANGDIISVIVNDKQKNKAYIPKELQYVRVITTTTDEGIDQDENVEKGKAVTVTVLVTPDQAKLLAKYNSDASLHFVLVYRGEQEKCDAFIKVQDEYLTKHSVEEVEKEENDG